MDYEDGFFDIFHDGLVCIVDIDPPSPNLLGTWPSVPGLLIKVKNKTGSESKRYSRSANFFCASSGLSTRILMKIFFFIYALSWESTSPLGISLTHLNPNQ